MFPLTRKVKKASTIHDHLFKGMASPFNQDEEPEKRISSHVLEVAVAMRGENRPPAIFLHGVLPRSGTVYLGEVIRLHPDIFAYPNKMWEMPFMAHAGDLIKYQKKFFQTYQKNRERMDQNDLLCLFGASIMNYLHSFVPQEKILLVKVPWMQFLNYFFTFFPNECLLPIIRDGRDTVHSTLKTWPNRNFEKVCREWEDSAEIYLALQERFSAADYKVCFVRFEDLLYDPAVVVCKVLEAFGLDWEKFPVEKIDTLPVRGSSSIKSEGKVSWSPVEKKKEHRPVGKWQGWSNKERKIFKAICGKTLIKLGYAEDLNW